MMAGEHDSRIIGTKKLRDKIKELGVLVDKEAARTAMMAGALPLQNKVKQLAPVLSGTLRRSYHTERVGKIIIVGTDVAYAAEQEFGKNPHFRPALDMTRQKITDEFSLALAHLIDAMVAGS